MVVPEPVDRLEVFADVSCPFAYVGITRVLAARRERGLVRPYLAVRAWPLELVNGEPLTGASLVGKIDALRRSVAPGLFRGFDPERFPHTTLPALALEAAAHDVGPAVGEAFSLAIRQALFEDGADISDPALLAHLMAEHDIVPMAVDPEAVTRDHIDGTHRGVAGSPHFFFGSDSWFCPSLTIRHDDAGYDIALDAEGLAAFLDRVLAPADAPSSAIR
jgi:predicted DsbA family dithiol-disulfide isomerase